MSWTTTIKYEKKIVKKLFLKDKLKSGLRALH